MSERGLARRYDAPRPTLSSVLNEALLSPEAQFVLGELDGRPGWVGARWIEMRMVSEGPETDRTAREVLLELQEARLAMHYRGADWLWRRT